jgi:hypothetical protein
MSQIVAVRRGGSGESLKELKEVEQAGAPDNSAHVINQCETQGAD